jgi:hypothetical protein
MIQEDPIQAGMDDACILAIEMLTYKINYIDKGGNKILSSFTTKNHKS